MTLTRIALRPFAGTASRELELTHNLNLLLGPNEAGKTTVFLAIQHVLFTRTDLSPARFEKEMGRFLPVGSGDTISVEIEFEVDSKKYLLRKRWGAGRKAELLFPDGSIMADEGEISGTVERFLGVNEGTCRSVLMSSQAGLTRTLEDLRSSYTDTLHSLGDILRRSILETDGISIDRFRSLAQSVWEDYHSRWDPVRELPEKGRDIRNPYSTKVGRILAAYYEKERLSASFAEAREFEEGLDALNRELSEISRRSLERERYLNENRDAVEAARERKDIGLELSAVGFRSAELRDANERWPVMKSKIEENRARSISLEKKAVELGRELDKAQDEVKARDLRERFRRLLNIRERLKERSRELEGTKKLTREELETLQGTHAAMERAGARIASGKLRVLFQAKKDMHLMIERDAEPFKSSEVKAGEALDIETGGRVRIEHADWTLEATLETNSGATGSGKGQADVAFPDGVRPDAVRMDDVRPDLVRMDGAHRDFQRAEEALRALYARHGLRSLEEASEANRTYEEAMRRARAAEEALQDELGGRDFRDIEAEYVSLGEPTGTRPFAEIADELAQVRGETSRLNAETQSQEKTIGGFVQKYGDQDRLLLLVSENVRRETDLRERLLKLPPLPRGVKDEEELIASYERAKAEHESLRGRIQELSVEIARLEGHGPDHSSEELEGQLRDAEERFERVKGRGKALTRIQALTETVLNEIDRSTYGGIQDRLEGYVASLTGGRYSRVQLRESLPEGLMRNDGNLLGYPLLSTGTKDTLALALRLTMAGYFLEGKGGFVIMDDPFANLDPDRQKRAAEVLRSFAESRQLLLFSCHPSAAELLGIAPILL